MQKVPNIMEQAGGDQRWGLAFELREVRALEGVLLVDKGIRYQNPRTFESLLSGSGQVNGHAAPATARN